MKAKSLQSLLVGSPKSLGARARLKRWHVFCQTFPDFETMRVLDLGGTADFWNRSPVQPAEVVVINLDDPTEGNRDFVARLRGNACDASAVLAEANMSNRFDLVFSNSLMEHVGGHAQRCELAKEISGLAPRRWIQTPYRYFFLEPHWLFPGMQFLPVAARVEVARRWPLSDRNAEMRAVTSHVLETELLSLTEMKFYFPDSTIWHERVFGMTKSLVAITT